MNWYYGNYQQYYQPDIRWNGDAIAAGFAAGFTGHYGFGGCGNSFNYGYGNFGNSCSSSSNGASTPDLWAVFNRGNNNNGCATDYSFSAYSPMSYSAPCNQTTASTCDNWIPKGLKTVEQWKQEIECAIAEEKRRKAAKAAAKAAAEKCSCGNKKTDGYARPASWSTKVNSRYEHMEYDESYVYTPGNEPQRIKDEFDQFAQKADEYEEFFRDAAEQYRIDPDLLRAVVLRESKFNPNAVSKEGAVGLGQFMLDVAPAYGVTDRTDPQQSIMGTANYLRQEIDKHGSVDKALAIYNGGIVRFNKENGDISKMSTETQNFVKDILTFYTWYKQVGGGTWTTDITQQDLTFEETPQSDIATKIINSAIATVKKQGESHACFANVKDALIPILGFRFADGIEPAYQGAEELEKLMGSDQLAEKGVDIIEVNAEENDIQPGDILVYRNDPKSKNRYVREFGHIGIYLGNKGPDGKKEASSLFFNNVTPPENYTGLRVFRVVKKDPT